MSALGSAGRAYLSTYSTGDAQRAKVALEVRAVLIEVLDPFRFNLHLIDSRAKGERSVREKLLRKKYKDPKAELTDEVGARVITHYPDEVDPIVVALKTNLVVDLVRSVDKRTALNTREFGYRSVHLICQATKSQARRHRALSDQVFEVQVRSVLEHAWAEIEHEVVYKSFIQFPPRPTRQFSAVAATLELMDDTFCSLRDQEAGIAVDHRSRFEKGMGEDETIDAARVIGLLEAIGPQRQGWRDGIAPGGYQPRIAATIAGALGSAGIKKVKSLRRAVGSKANARRVEDYAAQIGVAPTEVSHLAVVLLAIGARDRVVLEDWFPELSQEPQLVRVLDGR